MENLQNHRISAYLLYRLNKDVGLFNTASKKWGSVEGLQLSKEADSATLCRGICVREQSSDHGWWGEHREWYGGHCLHFLSEVGFSIPLDLTSGRKALPFCHGSVVEDFDVAMALSTTHVHSGLHSNPQFSTPYNKDILYIL